MPTVPGTHSSLEMWSTLDMGWEGKNECSQKLGMSGFNVTSSSVACNSILKCYHKLKKPASWITNAMATNMTQLHCVVIFHRAAFQRQVTQGIKTYFT